MNKVKLLGFLVAALVLVNIALMVMMVSHRGSKHHGSKHGGPDHKRHGGHHAPHGNPEHQLDRFIHELGFNEKQGEEFKKLAQQHMESTHLLLEKKHKAGKQLFDLTELESEEANTLLQELGSIESDLHRNHLSHLADVQSLCSEDQMPAFKEFKKRLLHQLAGPKRNGKR
ncbi:MAG: hypothetical protein ACPGED_01490 [Flavobacteriales bacterium]